LATNAAVAINERTKRKLDYALEEVQVVKEAFRAATAKERIPFSPDQRRRLAVEKRKAAPACTARWIVTVLCQSLDEELVDNANIMPLASPALRFGFGQALDFTLKNGGNS
jgi:hypothetical protein